MFKKEQDILNPPKKPQQPSTLTQEPKGRYPSQWELMLLAEEQDSEAFEAQDFEYDDRSFKQKYKDFYDDVKHPVDYVKEDW